MEVEQLKCSILFSSIEAIYCYLWAIIYDNDCDSKEMKDCKHCIASKIDNKKGIIKGWL